MYYVGWVGCHYCGFRSRVCIEVEGPVLEGRCIFVCCPNDDSQHRFSLVRMQLLEECPPGLQPKKLEDFDQVGRPSATRSEAAPVHRPWLALALVVIGAVGSTAIIAAWLAHR
jgi:hypothetical protein